MQIISKSDDDTRAIAKDLMIKQLDLSKPIVFLLYGDLGSGKTTFTKGIGQYLGLNKIVSPSFVANCEYDIANSTFKKLIHFDFYNLTDREYELIGLDEAMEPANIVVIEWPENNKSLMEKISKIGKIIEVKFEHMTERERKITI